MPRSAKGFVILVLFKIGSLDYHNVMKIFIKLNAQEFDHGAAERPSQRGARRT